VVKRHGGPRRGEGIREFLAVVVLCQLDPLPPLHPQTSPHPACCPEVVSFDLVFCWTTDELHWNLDRLSRFLTNFWFKNLFVCIQILIVCMFYNSQLCSTTRYFSGSNQFMYKENYTIGIQTYRLEGARSYVLRQCEQWY
jgi:hypothetical protein